MNKSVISCLLVIPLLIGTAQAQNRCFRGRPLPECKTFWITESSVLVRLDERNNQKWHQQLYYTFELGLMSNRDELLAFGGTMFLAFDDLTDDFRLGYKARFRRWLSPKTSLDLAPGILTGTKTGFPGLSVSVAVIHSDRIALAGQLDMLRYGDGQGTDFAWYGGVRFGSGVGLAMAIVGPIVALIAAAASFDMGGMGNMGNW
jgi:hypothetical protein